MASKEHLELSEFIKSVHQDLRTKSKNFGANQAWMDHCKNEDVLKRYASAMKTLATSHWVKNDEKDNGSCLSRIEWVVSHCNRYFFLSGRQEEINKEIALIEKHDIAYDKTIWDQFEFEKTSLDLLDVGSCYNPFKQFEMFDVTAIDLFPATEDVIKCDFLNAQIGNKYTPDDILCCERYDVVVFSLFLEYLPSPEQRYSSCVKAYDLLRSSGLLFILTPDSKHATANSKLMKWWRICLASVGFTRVYFEKLKHLHCMAFKKTCVKELPLRWFKMKNIDCLSAEDMMTIPQDSLKMKQGCESVKESDFDPLNIAQGFSALPQEEF